MTEDGKIQFLTEFNDRISQIKILQSILDERRALNDGEIKKVESYKEVHNIFNLPKKIFDEQFKSVRLSYTRTLVLSITYHNGDRVNLNWDDRYYVHYKQRYRIIYQSDDVAFVDCFDKEPVLKTFPENVWDWTTEQLVYLRMVM